MIDYLEDLLEEDLAVELAGGPLVPVGQRRLPRWEEKERAVRENSGLGEIPVGTGVSAGEGDPGMTVSGGSFWNEEEPVVGSGAAALLKLLAGKAHAAGGLRQQGRALTVTIPGESARIGGMDLDRMDRAVQRDARRYDGGFPLY